MSIARIYTRSITAARAKSDTINPLKPLAANVELVMSSRQQCEDILSRLARHGRFALNPSSDSLARPERLQFTPPLLSYGPTTSAVVTWGPRAEGKKERCPTGQEA